MLSLVCWVMCFLSRASSRHQMRRVETIHCQTGIVNSLVKKFTLRYSSFCSLACAFFTMASQALLHSPCVAVLPIRNINGPAKSTQKTTLMHNVAFVTKSFIPVSAYKCVLTFIDHGTSPSSHFSTCLQLSTLQFS